ncbi:tyrosine-protein kinase JAK2-like [Drosophila hydei]|uniref:Tyrosine-protein kinase JAK2-like n=1 Tax=Drosophila hydei TaxID=7224 RepID=A0A6J2SRT6_DROHY|nr:tyrosine-protein kinase JAK2-like [Drosophila hydei]XP_030080564.1 tyrosine-protein kinase JAK2-like [Drosophila hydei]
MMADNINVTDIHLGKTVKLSYGVFGEVDIGKFDNQLIAAYKISTNFPICSSTFGSLEHDNIIKLYGISNKCFLMEYTGFESLHSFLHEQCQGTYKLKNALNWMREAALGLEYIYLRHPQLTFLKLCPQLIYFGTKFSYSGFKSVKIAILPDKLIDHKKAANYFSPEEFYGEKNAMGQSDVFSIGIIIWEVLARKQLFHHTNYTYTEIVEAVLRGERPSMDEITIKIDSQLKSLMRNCWNTNPDERPTIQMVISTLSGILEKEECLDQLIPEYLGLYVDMDIIDMGKKIGEDCFSVSQRATWLNMEKTITKLKFSTDQWTPTLSFKMKLNKNIRINSAFLVNLYGYSLGKEGIYLISDYSDDGSLHDYVHGGGRSKFSVNNLIKLMLDAAEAICFLNTRRNIRHTFHTYILTPHNMILFNNFKRLKIRDNFFNVDARSFLNFAKTTYDLVYIAPEVFETEIFTDASEVYNFGIILYEVFARKKPYYNLYPIEKDDLRYHIALGIRVLMPDIEELKLQYIENLIRKCLHPHEHKRPKHGILVLDLQSQLLLSTDNSTMMKPYGFVHYSDINFMESIGRGSFGIVYRADWLKNDVAVKKIKIIEAENKDTALKAFEKEVNQLSLTNHENIVKLYGSCSHENFAYLVMDYAECGSLYNYLHGDEQKEYTMARALDWMIQCVQGIQHLHSMTPKPMLHRDLKTQNLLLTDNNRILKIADFGTATDLRTLMTSAIGTVAYMAPEVLSGEKYTEKCDIYSFGIVLWEVMARRKPFHHLKNQRNETIMFCASKGNRPPLDDLMPNCNELKTLIENCWHHNPENRPAAKNISLDTVPCFYSLIKRTA